MRTQRIENYEQYKAKIAREVQEIAEVCEDIRLVLAVTQELAEIGCFKAHFLFQDEDEQHYNHDIAKECQRRLNEISA